MPAREDPDLGSILGIWAHPDDEAWLSAGLMTTAVRSGRRVTCVTATKGEAGFAADDPRSEQERMDLRADELLASLGALGVTDHHWLGYRDGGCSEIADEDVVPRLVTIIDEVRPDTVLTFAPDGGTGHLDHVAACRWATLAVRRAQHQDVRLLYAAKTPQWRDLFASMMDPAAVMMADEFQPEMTDESDLSVWFACSGDVLACKVDAMRAQASQIEPIVELLGVERFAALVRDEFFRAPMPSDPF